MEIASESRHLRTICESQVDAQRELGGRVAKILQRRVADLRAAVSIRDIVAGNRRLLDRETHQFVVIDLCDDIHMILQANHVKNPLTAEGKPDWDAVQRVKITQIGSSDAK